IIVEGVYGFVYMKSYIEQLLRGETLTREAAHQAASQMLLPETPPEQIAAFLVLLRKKGETSDEIAGIIDALQAEMIAVPTEAPTLDIVGTGGDYSGSVNISTGAAILAASCGVVVAKHGNRAVSSRSGSADVLEALGIRIDLSAQEVSASLQK